MISKFDLKKYLVPGDTIYIVVIVLGLFILVFLNDLPVRLIGACIALLSGVMLVMNLSARLKDRVELRRPAPSQSVELSVKVKKDSSGTRYVFDDFESNFGGDDVPSIRSDETPERREPSRLRFDDTDSQPEPQVVTRRKSPYKNEVPPSISATLDEEQVTDFQDEISGMRIKGRRRSSEADGTQDATPSTDSRASQTPGTSLKDGADEQPSLRTTMSNDAVNKAEHSTSQQETFEPVIAKSVKEPISTASESDSKTETPDTSEVRVKKESQAKPQPSTQLADNEKSSTHTSQESTTATPSAAAPDEPSVQPGTPTVRVEPPHFAEAVPLPSTTDRIAAAQESIGLGAVPVDLHATPDIVVSPAIASDPVSTSRQRQLLLAMANLIDDAEHPSDEEPRKEFDYLLSRVLMVIRSMMNARTAAFFWVNLDQNELVLETHITDAVDVFRSQRKYPLGMDIVSQIAKSGRPEILTEIKPSAQSDLIPYYAYPAGTTSFVGVPVFLNHTVIGVLCADSTQDDAYDEITIGSLGHFTKLISGLTQSYTGKYDLLQSSRTLDALTHFRSLVNRPGASMQKIASALVESSSSIVESQTIGVVLFDRESERWTIHNISSQIPETESFNGDAILAEGSLIARTIFRGSTTCVTPVQSGVLRYHSREAALDNGFFIAVPLKSTTNCYGALFVEGHASQLTERDIAILETIGEQTGIILEQVHFQKMLKKSALLDESTGLLNSAAFISRMEEEIVRARDNKVPLVAVLVCIDRYSAIEQQLGHADKEEIFLHVLSLVRKYVRSYDALGRVDDNIIAVVMSGSKDSETQLWAERLRKEIAISVKEINKKRYTVTVSIGLAKAVLDDNAESLLTSAGRAMELASAKTNNVVVYA